MHKLAFGVLLLATSLSLATPLSDPYSLEPVRWAMSYGDVDVTVTWDKCNGEFNAFYYPPTHEIIMCEALKTAPTGFIQLVLAHEMSHAVIRQLHIPFTGSEEVAADELAGLTMVLMGNEKELVEAADYFIKLNWPELPWDDHPNGMRRGLTLKCIATRGTLPYCRDGQWNQVVFSWNKLLGN